MSTDFDLPTLLGLDSDDPMAFGEVGRVGVAIDTIEDVERLFDGIDLEKISVSLTINPSAWVIYAMFISVAEQRGSDPGQVYTSLQKAGRLPEIERSITEEKVFEWLIARNEITSGTNA